MKIKDINVGNLERLTSNRLATNRYQNAAKAPTTAPREDDVNFSSTARTISQAGEVAQNAPEIRSEVVDPIQDALQAGRYDVGSVKVADSILRQVLQYRRNAL